MIRHSVGRLGYFSTICLLILIWGSGGCIKHSVEIEEGESLVHYSDRFYDIAVIDSKNIWVVGFYGKILHSKDGGETWSLQKSGTNDSLTGVSFAHALKGWVTTLTGKILHTPDGGETWMVQEGGTANALLDVEFLDETHGWVVGANNTILRTEDGGGKWEVCSPPGEIIEDATIGLIDTEESILNAIHFSDLTNGWIVGEYGTVYKSNDGGVTWIRKSSGISPGNYLFDIHFTELATGWIVAIGGRIFKTVDAGENWIPYTSPTSNALYSIGFTNGQVWAAGTRGTLITCNSNTWQYYNSSLPLLSWFRGITFIDHDQGWVVGGAGAILKTSNGGKDWVVMK